MRDKIIIATAQLLDDLGIKFTIDDIATRLKISKKTVYKNFESKEELASAVFDFIVDKCKTQQQKILASKKTDSEKLALFLVEYMEIYRLQSEKIFNLYSLNTKLFDGIMERCEENWREVLTVYYIFLEANEVKKIEDKIFRIIIEGILQKVLYQKEWKKIAYDCVCAIVEK